MISYEQLNEQNHQIIELSNVLSYLFQDRAMCDTTISCDLFFRYIEKVNEHMDLVDNNLYGPLLAHQNNDIKNTARNFMSGGQEIRHILKHYEKKWCRKKRNQLLVGGRHEEFVKETNEMFGLIFDRIQRETERLYPLIREITGDSRHAA
ncbi:MAG: hypothetical protein PVI91_03790 [Gammaproteobacteria bacterium]|jgi:hypothetical protein